MQCAVYVKLLKVFTVAVYCHKTLDEATLNYSLKHFSIPLVNLAIELKQYALCLEFNVLFTR